MKNTIETLPLTHTKPGHTNKLHMGTSTAGGSRPQIAGVMVRPGRAFGPMCMSKHEYTEIHHTIVPQILRLSLFGGSACVPYRLIQLLSDTAASGPIDPLL